MNQVYTEDICDVLSVSGANLWVDIFWWSPAEKL